MAVFLSLYPGDRLRKSEERAPVALGTLTLGCSTPPADVYSSAEMHVSFEHYAGLDTLHKAVHLHPEPVSGSVRECKAAV